MSDDFEIDSIVKDDLEFHAAELRKMPGVEGWLPARIPAHVAEQMDERGRLLAMDTATTEIRFVTDAKNIRLTLSAVKPEFGFERLEVRIFFGDFEFQSFWLEPGRVTTLTFSPPAVLGKLKEEYLRRGPGIGFSPNVCRILSQRGGLIYCGIETFGHAVRPPEKSEKPAKTCLFYGSSITNSTLDGFPSVACRRLGADLVNLGLSGACHLEPVFADWLAGLKGWDLAVFELGINVLGWMEPEEFRSRVDHLLGVFTSRHPEKPLVLITVFLSPWRKGVAVEPSEKDPDGDFCGILRELYERYRNRGDLHLIEGGDILDSPDLLSADFLHPKIFGHAVMGLNLAEKLKSLL